MELVVAAGEIASALRHAFEIEQPPLVGWSKSGGGRPC